MKNSKIAYVMLLSWFCFGIATITFGIKTLTEMNKVEAEAKAIEPIAVEIVLPTIAPIVTKNESTFENLEAEADCAIICTQSEKELMARVVQAEAGNQDNIGKRLVVDCIINRVLSDDFPNTIKGVIYQAGAFATPASSFCTSDLEAVEAECESILDAEVIYFRTGRFHSCGTKKYQHGDHYFSGR